MHSSASEPGLLRLLVSDSRLCLSAYHALARFRVEHRPASGFDDGCVLGNLGLSVPEEEKVACSQGNGRQMVARLTCLASSAALCCFAAFALSLALSTALLTLWCSPSS